MSEDIQRRFEDLERRIKELEAQPREMHFHYPVYVLPIPTPTHPAYPPSPYPINPPWQSPWVTTTNPYPITNICRSDTFPPQSCSVNFH